VVSAPTIYQPPERGLFHLTEPTVGDALEVTEARPILHGGMWPSQRLWWELANFVRLFVGGYGSGKTLQLCKRMLWLAFVNGCNGRNTSPCPVAIVSPTYAVARQTVVTTIEDLLRSMSMWNEHWNRQGLPRRQVGYKLKQTPPYEFSLFFKRDGHRTQHGRIMIYSGEHPDKLKGPNLAAAGIDEPFIQAKEVFEQMSARCRHPRALIRELNLAGTPEQLNWGYDLAEGDLADKYDVGIVQASTLENKALPQDYVDRLLRTFDPKAAQAYVHGLFVNMAKGLVYYAFDRAENIVELEMPRNASIGVGIDFNVNPMSAAVFWVKDKGHDRHIHFFDEIELPNSDTQEMCKELKEIYGKPGMIRPHCSDIEGDIVWTHEGLRDVYPDSNSGRSTASPGGKTDYDYIEEAGFELHKRIGGNPHRRDRFNAVNGMLKPQGGRVRQTVSPRCKKMVKYQLLYSHELMHKEEQKRMSHLLDARDYPTCMLFPAERETMKFKRIKGA